jgi:large subunit ribosomal protein L19
MNATIRKIEDAQIIRKNVPFKVGDSVKVSLRIKEGEKERIQVYEGVVTAIQGGGAKLRFTVRKISYGVGVEKTFYFQSPMIKEVKTIRSGKVRRAKLFYLRGKLNKKDARIQESKRGIRVPVEGTAETAVTSPAAPAAEAAASEAPASAPHAEAPKETTDRAPEAKA